MPRPRDFLEDRPRERVHGRCVAPRTHNLVSTAPWDAPVSVTVLLPAVLHQALFAGCISRQVTHRAFLRTRHFPK